MSIQTSYSFAHAPGVMGMAADFSPSYQVTADATTPIGFGLGLVLDTGRSANPANQRVPVKLPSALTDEFAGVALLSHKQPTTGTRATLADLETTEIARYEAGNPIPLRKRGRIWVWSEQAVKPGDPVFLRCVAGGAGTSVGYFRANADTDKALEILNAYWAGTITAAGIVVLELNLP